MRPRGGEARKLAGCMHCTRPRNSGGSTAQTLVHPTRNAHDAPIHAGSPTSRTGTATTAPASNSTCRAPVAGEKDTGFALDHKPPHDTQPGANLRGRAAARLDARELHQRRHGRRADQKLVLAAHGERALRIVLPLERHKAVPAHARAASQPRWRARRGAAAPMYSHRHPRGQLRGRRTAVPRRQAPARWDPVLFNPCAGVPRRHGSSVSSRCACTPGSAAAASSRPLLGLVTHPLPRTAAVDLAAWKKLVNW